jgi:serine protease Do
MGAFAWAQPQPPGGPAQRWHQTFVSANAMSYLGVGVAEITSERAKTLNLKEEYGVEVTNVEKDSPADRAGVRTGDVVLEYNGHRVEGAEQFVRLVHETPVGRDVKLVIARGGATQSLSATIGNRKAPNRTFGPEGFQFQMPQMPGVNPRMEMPDLPSSMSWRSSMLGIEAESLSSQLAEYFGVKDGVLVRSVVEDSAAEKAGLKAGDVIVKVGERKVTTPGEITEAIRSAAGKTVPLSVMRNHREMSLTATLEQAPRRRGPRSSRTSGAADVAL